MRNGYKKCPRCGVKLADESKLDEKYVTVGIIMIFLLVAALIVMLLSCWFIIKIKGENRELMAKQENHSSAIEELQTRLDKSRNLYYRELLHDINYIVSSRTETTDLEYELKNLLQCNRLLIAYNKTSRLPRLVDRYIILTALLNAEKNLTSVKLTEKDYQILSPEFVEKCSDCRNGIQLCKSCKSISSCPECQLVKCTKCSASGFVVHIQRAEKALAKTRQRIRKFIDEEHKKQTEPAEKQQ